MNIALIALKEARDSYDRYEDVIESKRFLKYTHSECANW